MSVCAESKFFMIKTAFRFKAALLLVVLTKDILDHLRLTSKVSVNKYQAAQNLVPRQQQFTVDQG